MNTDMLNLVRLPAIKERSNYSYGLRISSRIGVSDEKHTPVEYTYGDNVRKIDWNTSAKTGVLHVHATMQDTSVNVHIVYNDSPSMLYGTERAKKDVQIQSLKALGYIGLQTKDRVLLETVNGAYKSSLVNFDIYDTLYASHSWETSSHYEAILERMTHGATNALVVLALDICSPASTLKYLRSLAYNNTLCILLISDFSELNLRSAGNVRLLDPETKTSVYINSSDEHIAQEYAALAHARYSEIVNELELMGAYVLHLSTGDDVEQKLVANLPRKS